MPSLGRTSAAVALAATATFAAASTGPAGAATNTVPGCRPVSNLEAIIDDSGSMSATDSNTLREKGLELFLAKQSNAKKTLGAVEFGSAPAQTVFAPQTISSAKATMIGALRAKILADNGGTDYDPAFQKAAQDNPRAQARIFLTDGANNGAYANSHLTPKIKTFVVGLGIGPASATDPDATRLQQIATDTGGTYFPSVDATKLQPVFDTISAAVSCFRPPRAFTSKPFTRPRQKSSATAPISSSAKTVDLVVNWAQPSNRFSVTGVSAIGRRNKTLATLTGKGRPGKLKVKKSTGSTFQSFSVTKPKGTQKVKFTVQAGRVFTPESTVSQVTIH